MTTKTIKNCVDRFGEIPYRIEIPKIKGIIENYAADKFKHICGNLNECEHKVEYKNINYCKYNGEFIG